MPLLPYALARPLLFQLEAERVHDMTMNFIARSQNTPVQWLWQQARVSDPVTLAGLQFPNRVGLAAGLDKNARCIDGLGAMGFGFIEVGTVTPKAQPGNPKPRMFRLPQAQALINRLGFNNLGVESFLENVQQSRLRRTSEKTHERRSPMLLGLNIGKNAETPIERAADDYLHCLEAVHPHADYVAINISSPNTKNLRSLQSDKGLDALLFAIARKGVALDEIRGKRVPLFVKIAPDLDDDQIDNLAGALLRHGMAGVIATNTTLARQAVQSLPHAHESGGLSGSPVRESSNRVIARLRLRLGTGFPIVGVGGILSAEDALGKVMAGADVVQIYTGLIYRGPALVGAVARALREASNGPEN
jgi:dihydroorotate dehydrogenase